MLRIGPWAIDSVWYGMVWYGMVEVCEGAPVAVSGWVLTDRHDVRPCAASSLLRVKYDRNSRRIAHRIISYNNISNI